MYLQAILLILCFTTAIVLGQNEINQPMCNDPKEPGAQCPGGTPSYRWYFDVDKYQCKRFKYNGCGGNGNNFVNYTDCAFCYTKIADAVRCWGNGPSGKSGQSCGRTFTCPAPYTCFQYPFFPMCCDYSDSTCPNGSPIYKLNNDEFVGDNCDDLDCPSGKQCVLGKYVSRCC